MAQWGERHRPAPLQPLEAAPLHVNLTGLIHPHLPLVARPEDDPARIDDVVGLYENAPR